MKTRTIFLGFMLLPLFCAIAAPARAQTGNQQDTLKQYVASLQTNPNDTALRGKIIALAQSMNPRPVISEKARHHYVVATTFAKKAKDDAERAKDNSGLEQAAAGFERAIKEYKAALLAAPWWTDVYKKLAMAQEDAGQFDDAIASLNLYLLTKPADPQGENYKLQTVRQLAAQVAWEVGRRECCRRENDPPPQNSIDPLLMKLDGRRYTCPLGSGQTGVIDVRGLEFVTGNIRGYDDSRKYTETYPTTRKEIVGRENPIYYGGNLPFSDTLIISEDGDRITWRRQFHDGDSHENIYLWQR
jgi:tetratricopeptide (TPR) repeat protein